MSHLRSAQKQGVIWKSGCALDKCDFPRVLSWKNSGVGGRVQRLCKANPQPSFPNQPKLVRRFKREHNCLRQESQAKPTQLSPSSFTTGSHERCWANDPNSPSLSFPTVGLAGLSETIYQKLLVYSKCSFGRFKISYHLKRDCMFQEFRRTHPRYHLSRILLLPFSVGDSKYREDE